MVKELDYNYEVLNEELKRTDGSTVNGSQLSYTWDFGDGSTLLSVDGEYLISCLWRRNDNTKVLQMPRINTPKMTFTK